MVTPCFNEEHYVEDVYETIKDLFLGGFQMMGIGILGEYIYRIYNETRERPVFVVDEIVNLNSWKDRIDGD